MRSIVVVMLLAAPAAAEPVEPEVSADDEEIDGAYDLTVAGAAHALDLGYEASAGISDDGAGDAMAIASLGADLGWTTTLRGHHGGKYQIALDAGATVSRFEGATSGTGAATRAVLALGPAPLPGPEEGMNAAFLPLSVELGHEGDLAALPKLSDRPDVARARYSWQRVTLGTRFMRAEVFDPDEEGPADEQGPFSANIDAFAFRAEARVTDQDASRIETTIGGAMLAGCIHTADDVGYTGCFDFFGIETRHSQLPDGTSASTDTVTAIRFDLENPHTGSAYHLGYGHVVGFDVDAATRERVIDHTAIPKSVGSIGWWKAWGATGAGWQFERSVYVTMAAEAAVDDRLGIESWTTRRRIRMVGRGYVAHTRRLRATGWRTDWTGGVEADASRDVGPFDVGVHVEAGRSFYSALDGADPDPSFGARGALTVRRAASRRWFY